MIRFEQVSKAYLGGRQALQGVTFHLQPGEMAFLTKPFRRREEYPAEAYLWYRTAQRRENLLQRS